jgi:hypothetical protein
MRLVLVLDEDADDIRRGKSSFLRMLADLMVGSVALRRIFLSTLRTALCLAG